MVVLRIGQSSGSDVAISNGFYLEDIKVSSICIELVIQSLQQREDFTGLPIDEKKTRMRYAPIPDQNYIY